MAIMMSLAETMAEDMEARMERQFAAIDLAFEEQKPGVVVTTILLVALGAYFDNALSWFPLRMLYSCAILTIKDRLVGHRRLGLLCIVIGFCVGEFVQQDWGFDLMGFGQIAYRDYILRIYGDHPRLVLGVTFGIYMVLPFLCYPVGGMIEKECVLHFCGCVVILVLTWMVR